MIILHSKRHGLPTKAREATCLRMFLHSFSFSCGTLVTAFRLACDLIQRQCIEQKLYIWLLFLFPLRSLVVENGRIQSKHPHTHTPWRARRIWQAPQIGSGCQGESRVLKSGLHLKKEEEATFQLNPDFLAEVLYWISPLAYASGESCHCHAIQVNRYRKANHSS